MAHVTAHLMTHVIQLTTTSESRNINQLYKSTAMAGCHHYAG